MPVLQIFSSQNFDLVATGIAIAAIAVLGISIFLANRNSITNKTFFLFSLTIIAYATANYLSYHITDHNTTIWFLRGIVFFATWASFLLFQFFYVFPEEKVSFPRYYLFAILPFASFVALLTLTPYIFSGVKQFPSNGAPAAAEPGQAIMLFGLTSAVLVVSAMLLLIKKYLYAKGILRKQLLSIMIGSIITFAGILILNVGLPLLLNNTRYIVFAPVLFFPFLGLTAYAILRYRLFNIKVIAVAILAFFLAVTIIFQVIFSQTSEQMIFGASQFILVVIFSMWLLQATLREVRQRELIEQQRKELEQFNQLQENLLHFISHEIKGYLTDGQNAFAGIIEGDYGSPPPQMRILAQTALTKMRKGVATVMDILDASNLKKGAVAYKKETIDFRDLVESAVIEAKPTAASHKLSLDLSVDESASYSLVGDAEKLRQHVIRNLIDNAINYTPQGYIHVTLARSNGTVQFSVKDTGVGITEEDLQRLFTEGGHGKNSVKINVHSTGYGLFIAKQVAEAHGGTIHVQSAGAGKGSEFTVELPAQLS